MFQRLFCLFIGLILFSCSSQESFQFEEVACQVIQSEYDHYQVFSPCRSFTYRAKYWDAEYNLISESLVRVTATGNAVPDGVANEQEGVAQYQYSEEEIDRIQAYNINSDLEDRSWIDQMPAGLFESPDDVWMLPFRENQFVFTQVAPYPSVNLPLSTGKQWTSNLIIYEGWGDWNNQQLFSTYEVVGQETLLKIEFGDIKGPWHITSYLDAGYGVSTHDFWYHEVFGFVKMQYKNYKGQLLVFELVEIE
ncbi:MAG: hypothetical protein R8G66_20820 [Cytophagales bacterium]|nr:hypothetical protein [Cytophagales bacterium]